MVHGCRWRQVGSGSPDLLLQPSLVVYSILPSRARYVINDLIGKTPTAVVVSDRYAGYAHIDASQRQVCWAECGRQVS